MKRQLQLCCLAALLLSLPTGCSKEDNTYSNDYRVLFRFYSIYHPTSVLTRSVGNQGMFCLVKSDIRQGVTHLLVTSNDMKTTEDLPITVEVERRSIAAAYMGAGNALIIGQSQYDGPKAYDGQCPVCLRDKGGSQYPLKFVADGQTVECTKCGRRYNMIADGAPTDDQPDGKNLLQYRITVSSEYIEVHN
jgi:nitrite reductase/ring-hydroxylating ferredoxin subunit